MWRISAGGTESRPGEAASKAGTELRFATVGGSISNGVETPLGQQAQSRQSAEQAVKGSAQGSVQAARPKAAETTQVSRRVAVRILLVRLTGDLYHRV